MSEQKSRRQFLYLSALGLTAALNDAGLNLPAQAFGELGAPAESIAANSTNIRAWSTYSDKRMETVAPLKWHTADAMVADSTIVVDADQKFQSILGFGGAFTDASCYTFNQMSADGRSKVYRELFDPNQLGLSVCRTCIGGSDYSVKAYSFDDGEADPTLSRFSIAHDEEYILPMLKEAKQVNPDLFLFSSPWSPPGWMKSNNSLLGGNMQRKHMDSYANYFVKFLQSYASAGVPIQAVTVQNEVDTDQDSRMPACSWPQEYEADFVRGFLGPAMEKSGLKTKIWVIDHNYNLWGRAIGELETPGLRKYCNSIAWHGYVGDPSAMTRVHDAFPDTDMYWTEGGAGLHRSEISHELVSVGANVYWNHAQLVPFDNDMESRARRKGRPNIGPFPCGGLLSIDSTTKEVTRSGQYFAIAHFSKFVRRNARRISSVAHATDLSHVAFENPNGEKVVIVTNAGVSRNISIQVRGSLVELSLNADSVTTVVWA